MIYIGIDPGKDGAMAFLYPDEHPIIVTFDQEIYAETLQAAVMSQPVRCCLEKVWGIKGQSAAGAFSFGENFGYIRCLLEDRHIPYQLVTPRKWKKEFQVTGDKNSSVTVCKRLFPAVFLRRTDRCKKDHDGMAEALLMAEYARRRL